jgi:nucleotide-binding universal stress UspA family protein
LDGSQLSEVALPHALHLARIFHSRLVLLQVLEAGTRPEGGELIEPLSWQIQKAESELYLRGIVTRLGDSGLGVEYQILEGRTPETIVQYAQNNAVDLVVISSHGHSGLSRWNISSVVSKVIEKVYLPVLVVRAYLALEDTGGEVRYKKILVPFDLSKRAECSLPVAITIAQADEGELVLAHVLRRPEVMASTPDSAELNRLADAFVALSQTAYAAYLDEMCARIPVPSRARLTQNDSIPRALHELVDQEVADLVIFCAHGQGGQAEWPYGSVSRNYIEQGTQPVLVLQDIPYSLVRPSKTELAAARYGSRG